MPENRSRDPLTESLAFYRDLGVRELFVSPGEAAASAGLRPEAAPAPATAPVAAPALAPGPAVSARTEVLTALAAEVAACRKCGLCETRTQTVFADGSPSARILFVGEAPGADEDAQGVPFVGRAGQLLTKMIERGMGLDRAKDVYIANVLKCRPPGNRNPEPNEIASCRGYLEKQIELVAPAAIVGLGKFACQFLLDRDEGMMRMRGRWGEYRGIPVMPTFHPSFLLRQPEKKREAWEDLKKVLERLGLPVPPPSRA